MATTPDLYAVFELHDGRLSIQRVERGMWVEVAELIAEFRPAPFDPTAVTASLTETVTARGYHPDDRPGTVGDRPIAGGWRSLDDGILWVLPIAAAPAPRDVAERLLDHYADLYRRKQNPDLTLDDARRIVDTMPVMQGMLGRSGTPLAYERAAVLAGIATFEEKAAVIAASAEADR